MRLSTVQTNCFVLLAAIAVALTISRLALPVFDQLGWLVIAMMAVQLLIEPWAGVLYSYRKIALSTAAGLPALVIAYGAVAGPGLTLLAVTRSGSAEAIWAVLLATRVVFAILLAWTPRISMPAGPDWRRGVIRRRRDAT
ncbi:hypothetical protein [Microbacterium plantarum]|nr:hypothetical protein [Microbacterium plantarum]WRK17545.1 hypothetical protein VC184_00610 [Microbacterium plantarum]